MRMKIESQWHSSEHHVHHGGQQAAVSETCRNTSRQSSGWEGASHFFFAVPRGATSLLLLVLLPHVFAGIWLFRSARGYCSIQTFLSNRPPQVPAMEEFSAIMERSKKRSRGDEAEAGPAAAAGAASSKLGPAATLTTGRRLPSPRTKK